MSTQKDDRKLDGKQLSTEILANIKNEIETLKSEGKPVPGLSVVLVGDRGDSATYVKMKERACNDVGIQFNLVRFDAKVEQETLIQELKRLNTDSSVHGIIVQLPLPDHINEKAVLDLVSTSKDVDGFHPLNIGKLAMKGHEPDFIPCTPQGCMEILKRYNINISGKRAVVIGRSNIVGIPVSLLLLNENATVTVCHSRTENIESICREADILVAAIGKASYVKKDWIKPGAIIIDVGINTVKDETRKLGYRLVGDVDKDAYEVASQYTPVPGGVGPMTVAMLLSNTLKAFKRGYGSQ